MSNFRFLRTKQMKNVFYIFIISILFGDQLGNESYLWPTDASKTLTTVFGDVRPRRYHAGMDVRTYGVSGHDLYAIESGYIERIRVSSSGYGKAIYLRLIDERIAVYAHLSKFTPELNELVKTIQEKENSYSINQILEPNKYKVNKGDIIGYTGDTGSLSGPHLHFEIRDENNKPLNPLLTNYSIKDSRFPIAKELAILPLEESANINGEIAPIIVPIKKVNEKNYKIEDELIVSGQFGLAIKIIDRIDQQPFQFGLFGLELYIDEEIYYSIKYEHFDFDEGELVYTERDYALIRSGEGKFYRLFKDNSRKKLSFHNEEINNFPKLKPGKHNLKIIAYDYNQNEIEVSGEFIVKNNQSNSVKVNFVKNDYKDFESCIGCQIHQYEHGTIINIPKKEINDFPKVSIVGDINSENNLYYSENEADYQFLFNPTEIGKIDGIIFESNDEKLKYNIFGKESIPGKPFELNFKNEISVLGSGDSFYDTAFVWLKKIDSIPELKKGEYVSNLWEIGPDLIPYKNQIEIEISPSNFDENSINQTSIYYFNKKNKAWYFMLTTFSKDKNVFKTSALSGEIFALIKETNPPEINSVSPYFGKTLNPNLNNKLSFKIKDDLSGIDGETDVEVKINNKVVIHEYNSYRREIIYELNEQLVLGNNSVEITVNDRAGNSSKIEGKWKIKKN